MAEPPTRGGRASLLRFWLAVGGAAAAAVGVVAVIQARNPRVLVSWHGFLHAAIVNRSLSDSLPPENPFFAGETLPYYWFHHLVAAGVAAIVGVDPIRALQIVTLSSLALLVVSAGAIGRRRFGSTAAGLLIGWLALAGANPLGPLIALAKYAVKGAPLLAAAPPDAVTQQLFVSNLEADRWMTHPLLPALHLFDDWRLGQNVVWFLDGSSRAPALA
ncbi:MAG: DUF2298 domain-containing protein, partial [Candidatus Binatia bacterium]